MSRSASSSGRVARARSMPRWVTADIRRAVPAQPRMPSAERSLVYANPRRRSSMTRMPTPRSPRAITLSIAPSLISTDPDWASRRNTSPSGIPTSRSACSAVSTIASLVSRSLMRSFQLSADDDRGDPQRGLRVGDGRALPILPAGPRRVPQIGPDHVDLAHELWTLADERRAAERLRQLAVADPVALGDLEREVPRNDVDLTATHLLHEHAVLHRPEDLVRVRRAASDHRVRHPADRQIAKRFATRVSAPLDAELLGVLPVREVRPQDPLLDEHRPLSRRSFVVHRRGPALVGIRPVVDDRDELARDFLADPSRVHRETLQVQVGLEAVADGLVDECSAGLARQDDRARSRGCGLGADVEDGPPRRVPGRLLDRFVGQHLEAGRAAKRLEA